MFVSLGQGGNQLAACFWQRVAANQHGQPPSAAAAGHSAVPRARSSPDGAATASAGAASSSSAGAAAAPAAASSSRGGSSSSGSGIPRSPWFALDGAAHAVCIDAEPKVVQQMQKLGYALAATEKGGDASSRTATTSAGRAAPSAAGPSPPQRSFFRPSNLRLEQYGRGNNWAMGYFGRVGLEGSAGSLLAESVECVRREAERMEVFDSLTLMHSLAGGTGSGLGSRLAEELRDAFPKVFLISVSIAPFGAGDTPLQHYNSLLALSHLYPALDGLVLASNADIARALGGLSLQKSMSSATLASGARGPTAPTMAFDGINTYLSAALADVLAPTRTVPALGSQPRVVGGGGGGVTVAAPSSSSSSSSLLATPSLYELLSHVAPLPSFKLLEIWSSAGLGSASAGAAAYSDPRAPPLPSWKSCLDTLARFVPRSDCSSGSDDEAGIISNGRFGSVVVGDGRALAYTCYARGDSPSSFGNDSLMSQFDTVTARMAKLFPPVSWNPHPLDLVTTPLPRLAWRAPTTAAASSMAAESHRSLSVCVNRARTALSLAPSIRRARLLLHQRAYVHWYTRYGVELDEMHEAVDAIETVIKDYASA